MILGLITQLPPCSSLLIKRSELQACPAVPSAILIKGWDLAGAASHPGQWARDPGALVSHPRTHCLPQERERRVSKNTLTSGGGGGGVTHSPVYPPPRPVRPPATGAGLPAWMPGKEQRAGGGVWRRKRGSALCHYYHHFIQKHHISSSLPRGPHRLQTNSGSRGNAISQPRVCSASQSAPERLPPPACALALALALAPARSSPQPASQPTSQEPAHSYLAQEEQICLATALALQSQGFLG